MDELKRNGSGYVDPTAYKAIKQEDKNEIVNNGEVWEITQNNGFKKYVVVLSAHKGYATVLQLSEDNYGGYPVNCKGVMYTDCGKLGYCFTDKFESYIRSLTDGEYQDLMANVAVKLGLPAGEQTAEVEKVIEKPVEIVKEIVKPDAETEKALTQAQTERDIYKSLYQDLISTCLAGMKGEGQ